MEMASTWSMAEFGLATEILEVRRSSGRGVPEFVPAVNVPGMGRSCGMGSQDFWQL